MKVAGIVSAVILSLVVLLGVVGVTSYIKYANMGTKMEQQLIAEYDKNKTTLNAYTMRVQEMAQVPDMYVEDLQKIVQATFEGRYGEDGSQAVFQLIREQNLQFDSSLYTRLQQTMEAGRAEFKHSQDKMIDVKRMYETSLGYVWSGFWLRLAGFPKTDLSMFKVIVADEVQVKFATGKDSAIKLR